MYNIKQFPGYISNHLQEDQLVHKNIQKKKSIIYTHIIIYYIDKHIIFLVCNSGLQKYGRVTVNMYWFEKYQMYNYTRHKIWE